MADEISMDDFNESLVEAVTGEAKERAGLLLLALAGSKAAGKVQEDLHFSETTRSELERAYLTAKQDRVVDHVARHFLVDDARKFIARLENCAQAHPAMVAVAPDRQRRRQELLSSLSKQAIRLAEILEELDGDALGWLLAGIEQEATPDSASLIKDPFRAVAYALSIRQELVDLLPKVSNAAEKASKTLPVDNSKSPKLATSLTAERIFFEHAILDLFTPSKAGFAYQCLSEVFALAEDDAGDPTYWIKQVLADPESMTATAKKYKWG